MVADHAVESTPPPPEGYDDPSVIAYPTIVLFLGSIALGLGAAGLYGWLRWALYGPDLFDPVIRIVDLETGTVFTHDIIAFALALGLALFVTVVVHELLHGWVLRQRGYAVEYGVLPFEGVFFTAATGQFQPREDLFAVGLAPFVVITLVAVPLVLIPQPHVGLAAYLVLVINTAGSVGDLYMTWRLWRLPAGSLVYDLDVRRTLVFLPAG